MKMATWNVNSIRARQDRLMAFLQRTPVDVLCLQELKTDETDFPRQVLEDAGFHVSAATQRTYNGVAILSRAPQTDVVLELGDGVPDPQARFVAATVEGVRVVSVYVPNGGEVGSDKYAYKLEWLKRLRAWLDSHARVEVPLAVCGDFNVAPEARDVHDPAVWMNESLFHEESRKAFQHVLEFGLQDTLRLRTQDPGIFTWWDYRMLGFPKNRGLRIDHVLVTPGLGARCTEVFVDRNERKGKLPSDHVPVVVTFS